MSDTCLGASVVGINGNGSVPLQGTASCTWQGMMETLFPDWADPAAHFEGAVTEDGTITGGINFGPVQDVITGEFTGEGVLEVVFQGSFQLSEEQRVLYEGRLTGELQSSPE